MSDKTHKLFLYRDVDGKRMRCTFTVDSRMTILSEECQEDAIIDTRATYNTDKLQTHPNTISPEDAKAIEFFVESTPCWFEGCDQMRQEYNEELKKAGGDKCVGCAKGRIMRKFIPRVKEAMANQK